MGGGGIFQETSVPPFYLAIATDSLHCDPRSLPYQQVISLHEYKFWPSIHSYAELLHDLPTKATELDLLFQETVWL